MGGQPVKWAAAGTILAIAIGLIALVLSGVFSITAQEVRLPVLAIGGIIALFITLSLVSIAFAVANLSDRTQALGLPEGSVRSAIALGLLVLFAIISIYLHGSLSAGEVKVLSNLADAQKQEFIKNAQVLQRIQIVSETTEEAIADKKDSEKRYKQGTAQFVATGVTSNASVIKCKFDLPATAPTGAWDVIATDGSGKKSMLSGALTLT